MKTLLFACLPLLGMADGFDEAVVEIVEIGQFLNRLGLCSATAGNFSKKIDTDLYAMTVSGKHKGELTTRDVMLIDGEGKSLDSSKKPSAETALHMVVYRMFPEAGAVLHTHSVNGTVLSRLLGNSFVTKDYEIHKAFGLKTHESLLELPIFENSQDYALLSQEVADYLEKHPQVFGFFLRGHGLYTWGKDLKEAKVRTEAFEFLFDCELKTRIISGNS